MQSIICSNGHPCNVSVEMFEGKDIIKLDFNIKRYKVCENGWKNYKFPSNIIINDKLYLDVELMNKVVDLLTGFIKTGGLNVEEITNRGFSISEFEDLKGNPISIQVSSSAMDYKIWFGCRVEAFVLDVEGKLIPYKFPKDDVLIEDRLHLNQNGAYQLKNAMISELRKFQLENELEVKEEKPKKAKRKI